jgi:hypothetical protein
VDDQQAQLASYKARRELALIEGRDPHLIAALDKRIAGLTKSAAGQSVKPENLLTPEEDLYVEADDSTVEAPPLEVIIHRELIQIMKSQQAADARDRAASDLFIKYQTANTVSKSAAEEILKQARLRSISARDIAVILKSFPVYRS